MALLPTQKMGVKYGLAADTGDRAQTWRYGGHRGWGTQTTVVGGEARAFVLHFPQSKIEQSTTPNFVKSGVRPISAPRIAF